MLVFRDGRRQVQGRVLLEQFVGAIKSLPQKGVAAREVILDVLLRAGELECALADAASPDVDRLAPITDATSDHFVRGISELPISAWLQCLSQISPPQAVQISSPEGFAYYELHPLQFAELTYSLPIGAGTAAV